MAIGITVGDLIEELKKYPDDWEVLFNKTDWGLTKTRVDNLSYAYKAIVLEPLAEADSTYEIQMLDRYEIEEDDDYVDDVGFK